MVEKTSEVIPKQIGNPSNPNLDAKAVNGIFQNYENYPSITKIKENIKETTFFDFPQAGTKDINFNIISKTQESYFPR